MMSPVRALAGIGATQFGLLVVRSQAFRRSIAATLAAAFLLGLVLAGCGNGAQTRPDVVVTGARVYAATVNAGSADISLMYALTTGKPKSGISAIQSGPFSWLAGQGELTMTVTSPGENAVRRVQIVDGANVYSRIAVAGLPTSSTTGLVGSGGWSESSWSGGVPRNVFSLFNNAGLLGAMGAASEPSPATILGLLGTEAGSVKDLGRQALDGVDTSHYRAVVPFSHLGAGTSAELVEAEQLFGTASLGVDYWVDSSDLLRQLRFLDTILRPPSTTTTAEGAVALPITYPITLSVTLRLSNYGTPVHIVPPSQSEITSRQSCVASPGGISCQ